MSNTILHVKQAISLDVVHKTNKINNTRFEVLCF